MSMYAVVAPGLSCIYSNWKDVERVKELYPYPKWVKVQDEKQAEEWLKRNSYGHGLRTISKYGDILPNLYVSATYRIFENCVCIVYDTSKIGSIRVPNGDYLVEYKEDSIRVKIPEFYVSEESIAGHLSVVYNILDIIGEFVDIDITLPYYSIYYCLASYKGNKLRAAVILRDMIKQRMGSVSYSMKFKEVI